MFPKPNATLINRAHAEWRESGLIEVTTMALLDAAGYHIETVIETFEEEKRDNG